MAKLDEISSTEKLLDLIRGKRPKPHDVSVESPVRSIAEEPKPVFVKKLSFKRKIVIGVDIGISDLKLAAIVQTGEKKSELLNYTSIPIDSNTPRNSVQFQRLLKTAMTGFCGAARKAEIWSVMSSARVETRYIRIPKVATRQVANAVYWTYKKEVNFNDSTDIFDFEVLGDIVEEGVRRLEVVACSAPKQDVQELKNLFSRIGYQLSGVSIVPFAFQNFLRSAWMDVGAKSICNLFIGSDWSRIAIFSEGNLILSREIKSGIQSIVEAIREHISVDPGGGEEQAIDLPATESLPEKRHYHDSETARTIFDRFLHNRLSDEDAAGHFSQEEVMEMITPAMERIVRQVERTVEHYSLNFKNESVKKIFVSGETSANPQILSYVGRQLEFPVEVIDPFAVGISIPDSLHIPETEIERGDFVPAIGIALSNNALTPNFIYTYKDKDQAALANRFDRAVFTAVIMLIIFCLGSYFWQGRIIAIKTSHRNQLSRQVDRYIPYVDQDLILAMVAKLRQSQKTLAAYGDKYYGSALIGWVSENTPPHIRLLRLSADFGSMRDKKSQKDKKEKDKKAKKLLLLEGVIFGERVSFESSLADYLVKLKKSPMFGQVNVLRRSVDMFEEKDAMNFSVQLELI